MSVSTMSKLGQTNEKEDAGGDDGSDGADAEAGSCGASILEEV